MNELTPAVMENRIKQNELAIHELAGVVKGLAETSAEINTNIRLLQQSYAEMAKQKNANAQAIEELQTRSNLMRGGWLALCAIGSVLVVLSSVIGALAAALMIKR